MLKQRLLALGLQPFLTAGCAQFLILAVAFKQPLFAGISILCGSFYSIRSAWNSARERQIDVNLLMLLAAAGAIILNSPVEAAGLLFLFSLSNTLEQLAMARTKSAIEALIRLRPSEATVVLEEGDKRVPVNELQIGDMVRVKPYETIPVDGVMLSQHASVDEATMTGESIPSGKASGDKLFCGTQNLHEMLTMSVTASIGQTTLDRVVELVRDAQDNKASGERISSWFGSRYTVFVVAAFAVAFIVHIFLGSPVRDAAYSALVLLVALSPCALVISIPASTLSALAWAARRGILVRGGKFIEEIGRVDTAAFDKTGTLTRGHAVLQEICLLQEHAELPVGTMQEGPSRCWLAGDRMESQAKELLRLGAAAEQYSSHPVATAVVTAAREHGIDIPEITSQRDLAGLGVEADVDGMHIVVGQKRLIEDSHGMLDPAVAARLAHMQSEGMTVAVIRAGDRLAAFGVADVPRPEARNVMSGLRSLNIKRLVMLSGDTQETANAVGAQIGIEDVHAGLLPDQKTEFIQHLTQSGKRVMMVGDGINDAPSLASANVGVAMGGIGSDITLNAADVVLMRDNLSRILDLVRLGRRTVRIINANLLFASLVIISLTISSFVFKLPLWLAVLGHEGSTVIVLLNGLRLLGGVRTA